jgi:hypothetical protein
VYCRAITAPRMDFEERGGPCISTCVCKCVALLASVVCVCVCVRVCAC